MQGVTGWNGSPSHQYACEEEATIVTLVNFSQLLRKPKPPRGDPYFDPVRTLNTKMFSFKFISNWFLMESRKQVKEIYSLCNYYCSITSTQRLALFPNVTNKTFGQV